MTVADYDQRGSTRAVDQAHKAADHGNVCCRELAKSTMF